MGIFSWAFVALLEELIMRIVEEYAVFPSQIMVFTEESCAAGALTAE